MKEKYPEEQVAFHKNFFSVLLLYLIILILFGFFGDDGLSFGIRFQATLNLLGIFSILHVAYTVGQKYYKYVKIDQLRQKKGLSYSEFREKYEEIMDILI